MTSPARRSPDDVTAGAMFERRRHALVTGLLLLAVAATLTIVVIADRTGSSLQRIDDRWLDADGRAPLAVGDHAGPMS